MENLSEHVRHYIMITLYCLKDNSVENKNQLRILMYMVSKLLDIDFEYKIIVEKYLQSDIVNHCIAELHGLGFINYYEKNSEIYKIQLNNKVMELTLTLYEKYKPNSIKIRDFILALNNFIGRN